MLFTLMYLQERPLYDYVQPYRLHGYPELPDEQQTNCVYEEIKDVFAQDVRQLNGNPPSLEQNGFEFKKVPTCCSLNAQIFEADDDTSNRMVRDYLEETMRIVKDRLNPCFMATIDWRFRRNSKSSYPQRLEVGDIRKQAIAVATTVHCDFSYAGGMERIKTHLNEDEWSRVENGLVKPMIVNLWRPIHVVQNTPLLFADRRTVAKNDLVEADQIMLDKVNRTAYLYYRHEHKWYWLSNQCQDEVAMFVTWTPATSAGHAGS